MKTPARFLVRLAAAATLGICLVASSQAADEPKPKRGQGKQPLKALLITGGCCHNYPFQSDALTQGVSKMARVDWTVVNEGGKGTDAMIDLYSEPTWADAYDVVVHNECFASTTDADYIRRITAAHKKGKSAVVIHCAMHTYRAAEIDDWRRFLGVTSRRHEHQSRYPVKKVSDHPIMQGFPEGWITPKDELYIIEKTWPRTKVLATSASERTGEEHAVFWTSRFGKARVFGTTYGHSDETFRDPVFIETVAKGLLWSAKALKKDGTPKKRYTP